MGSLEGLAGSSSQREDIYSACKKRQMVRAGGGKWLKSWTLEFEIKYGGWQESAETNDSYIS